MQEVVAPVHNVKFDLEISLEQQLGAQPLPFPGMDKSGAGTCLFFLKNACSKGSACPFRHVSGEKSVVCKHWLRGLCKKGDQCEFLHEYDMTKMPECYFFSKFSACSNKECPFLHIDPESKIKDCPWYDRGFCRHGPHCRHKHTRRVLCINYLNGFCPEGKACKHMHPCFDIPLPDPKELQKKQFIVCHSCGEAGHKSTWCPKATAAATAGADASGQMKPGGPGNAVMTAADQPRPPAGYQPGAFRFHQPRGFGMRHMRPRFPKIYRNLEEVTCYKCGETGHYANRCPKGHLAFLSAALVPGATDQVPP